LKWLEASGSASSPKGKAYTTEEAENKPIVFKKGRVIQSSDFDTLYVSTYNV
jgi:hypothetical protein